MKNQPHTPHDPDQLAMLTRVLQEAVAATVASHGSVASDFHFEELRSRLGRVIMDHFVAGETDPEMLKIIAMASIRRR